MLRQKTPNASGRVRQDGKQELPIGSELAIGLTLGLIGWWAIVHVVMWIAGQ